MDCQYLPLASTGQFSSLFLDYLDQKDSLKPFYNRFPDLQSFQQQIDERTFDAQKRTALVDALNRQYQHIANKPDVSVLLDPKTFTVTTGHQLNIFTGPLYIVYKLITTIKLARRLKETYPDYTFVPVYWMATEDHDFAEINHFSMFGKNYAWQTEQRGAVGRMNPQELKTLFDQIPEKLALFEEAYLKHDTLADAVRYYINELFGAEGLVCLDADDAGLKQVFAPVIRDELTQQKSGQLVQEQTEKLSALGYKTVIAPRDINLFYLDDQIRERIEHKDGVYKVLHTKLRFSESEMLALLDEHPERFSPNVVLRPLYQETILPNLVYIGGPSEVPYWLQLKPVFDQYQTPFPMLMPRNFAMYVPTVSAKRIRKLGLVTEDLFQDTITLKREFVELHTSHALKFDNENKQVSKALDAILHKAQMVDPTLEKAVLAETKRFANAVTRLEKKMRRAEEHNQETGVRQLLAVKNELFPNGSLQERSENFLTFYLNDRTFLQKMLSAFDPLDYRMQLCLE
ncbi:bacillithiol biosynthesis cysteine-adding enzyme BshC [Spirosoma utsteinense]|uniref:Putative cysteine ligase BshC n=1 Tax=Spirosoma utsteinense TaxID=2585773 RepID=A0ABR6W6H6_9BACT|nr:bacillithiol biosynthesis cysteine-adding enzyme BshC [Spirosoma utsteinense]MBC3785425.1 bacillithiol biosynthesis cysteine-adding enzyme BshC [Spirosoma utsteinense]MBC3791547.1 bacillithiol biosynthesis cysteine-adding enzyme BshC [Spirosoma utsteinense]